MPHSSLLEQLVAIRGVAVATPRRPRPSCAFPCPLPPFEPSRPSRAQAPGAGPRDRAACRRASTSHAALRRPVASVAPVRSPRRIVPCSLSSHQSRSPSAGAARAPAACPRRPARRSGRDLGTLPLSGGAGRPANATNAPAADQPDDLALRTAAPSRPRTAPLEQRSKPPTSSASRSIVIASRSRSEVHSPSSASSPPRGGASPPPTAASSARWQTRSG